MTVDEEIAHPLRRAGFGSSQTELDRYTQLGYDAAVDRRSKSLDTAPPPMTLPAVRPPAAAPGRRAWRPNAEHPWRREYAEIR